MPLIALARLLSSLLSLALLGICAYLLWSWYQGDLVRDAAGDLYRVRETWRLWVSLGLLAWSLLGRVILTPIIAGKDKGPPSGATHGDGKMVEGASGAQLYIQSVGPAAAPVIVMTHGWGLDSTIWGYAKRQLTDHRLILWDLPGLGRSKPAKGRAVSLDDFAADLGTVIEQAGDQPVVLVGHSIGGMTIQTLARDNPALFQQRVAGVVLINTTYTNPLQTMILSGLVKALRWPVIEPMMRLTIWLQPLAWLSAWQSYLSGSAHLANRLGFGRFVTHSQLEHTTLLATRNAPGVQAKGNLAMFRWDASAVLPKINKPVLVLSGDADLVTKLEASRVIAGAIPGARLQVIDGVNHMGFLERADVYNEAIRAFTRSVGQTEARSTVLAASSGGQTTPRQVN
jgi:pimeloyl-ACP methyl ester carboxylesterase